LRIHEGFGWQDLVTYVEHATNPSLAPSFLDVLSTHQLGGDQSASTVVRLTAGTYGVGCVSGSETDPQVYLGPGPIAVN
jgi:hypothetical protein